MRIKALLIFLDYHVGTVLSKTALVVVGHIGLLTLNHADYDTVPLNKSNYVWPYNLESMVTFISS